MIKTLIKQQLYPLIKSRPDFLIIGAQKAGTTSLYEYLTQHPQVVGNKSWKEIRYFDLPENYSQGLSWYLGHFPSRLEKGNRLTFDASPSYLYFKHISELIQQDLGNIKMIAILRNPVDRAYSAWKMYSSFFDNPHEELRKIADGRTFAEAIQDELDGKVSAYPYGYINRGKYAEQLQNYYQHFDRQGILVLNIDRLKENMPLVLGNVCDFLGIKHFSEDTLQKLQVKKHNVGKYQEKASEEVKTLEQLKNHFAPFNQELSDLLGQPFNW